MVDVAIKIFEGKKGLQVRVVADGKAESPRVEIYAQELREAIKQAVERAGARVAGDGLGAPLSPEFKKALSSGTKLVPDVPAAQSTARPPMFSEWRSSVGSVLEEMAKTEEQRGAPEVAAGIRKAAGFTDAAATEFLQEMVAFNRQRLAELQQGGS